MYGSCRTPNPFLGLHHVKPTSCFQRWPSWSNARNDLQTVEPIGRSAAWKGQVNEDGAILLSRMIEASLL